MSAQSDTKYGENSTILCLDWFECPECAALIEVETNPGKLAFCDTCGTPSKLIQVGEDDLYLEEI